MSELIEILASYVPTLITRRLALKTVPQRRLGSDASTGAPEAPTSERLAAAVLFAKVSGFAALAERLAGQGPVGAEMLSRLLNRYFGQLIDLIIAHGGDIVKFAGDGLLALWPVLDVESQEAVTGDSSANRPTDVESALADMTLQAAQCGLAAAATATKQTALWHNFPVSGTPTDDLEPLALRVTLDAGDISVVYVGGERDRWEFLLVGLPLIQIGEAEALTQPGDVMLCPQAWQLVRSRCSGLRLPTGAVRLRAIHDPISPQALAVPHLSPVSAAPAVSEALAASTATKTSIPEFPEIEDALWSYIPGAIRARLDAGQSGWLAELRTVTVLLINLPDLNLTAPLALAQGIMLDVQRALYRYEGSVSKISVNDKGVTFVTAMGLAPLAHKDDAARGVKAALEIHARLRSWGLRNAMGIATGQAFCGVIGNEKRREYTLIGEPVNMATRLMRVAGETSPARLPQPEARPPQSEPWGERSSHAEGVYPPILTDAATYQAAKNAVVFSTPSAMVFEGRAESVFVHCPVEVKDARPRPSVALVGREEERQQLMQRLQALLQHKGGVVIIEGEVGIGKSRVVEMLLHQAEALGMTALLGRGETVEKTTAYYAWRAVFRQLFHLDPPPHAVVGKADADLHWTGAPIMGTRHAYIMAYLKRVHPSLVRLAPLLKTVLPLDIADNYLTVQMNGKARADNTRELLLQLLQEAADINPLVLVFEDTQWLDPASWALVRLVGRRIRSLMLVIVTSLLPEPLPEAYAYLRTQPETYFLRLRALSIAETRELIRERLGMTRVPDSVVNFVYEKTEGHPLFVEELVYAMRDAGLLHFTDGECRLVAQAASVAQAHTVRAADFLDTIQGAITGRIDRLNPPQQLTLKVASIIGQTFTLRILRDIYPIAEDKPHLQAYLQDLIELDLIGIEGTEAAVPPSECQEDATSSVGSVPSETPVTYSFKHVITQEVAYNLMAFSQRRQLHRAVAEWYERTYAGTLASFYPLLAHHWARADVPARTSDYLAKAGEQALHSGAYQEAIRFFKEALATEKTTPPTAIFATGGGEEQRDNRVLHARWERLLAEAYGSVGDTGASIEHMRQALRRLEHPEPETRQRLWIASLRQILTQGLQRLGVLRLLRQRASWWPPNALPSLTQGPQLRRTDLPTQKASAVLFEAGAAYRRLAELYYFNNQGLRSFHAGLRALNALERANLSVAELAQTYADLCVGSMALPFPRWPAVYKARAQVTLQSLAPSSEIEAQTAASGRGLKGATRLRISMYEISMGHWDAAQEALEELLQIAEHAGNWRLLGDSLMMLIMTTYYQGNFSRVAELGAELDVLASRYDTLQPDTVFPQQACSLTVQGISHLHAGRLDKVITSLKDEKLCAQDDMSITRTGCFHMILNRGLLAVAYVHREAYTLALETIATLEAMLESRWPFSAFTFDGYTAVPQVYLALWEAAESPLKDRAKSRVAGACRSLRRYARRFPIGEPRAWLYAGLRAWLAGRAPRARRAWRKSLAAAERLAMPYEEGLAHYELGRHLPVGDVARRKHLAYACKRFTQVGAAYDLQRVEAELQQG